jgi:NitT/TauT family transport system ATP-binding protein
MHSTESLGRAGTGGIRCEHVYKWFGDELVVGDLQVSVENHEFVCVVGPSGCGKTTLLRMIAGLTEYDSGTIRVGDVVVTSPLPNVAVVFQHFGLFPWKTVASNIGLPLRAAGLPKAEVGERVADAITLVGLQGAARRYPAELSGGMRQRVGLARALSMRPEVILLDEPFAAVDAQTREILQGELLNLWSRHRQTALFITHTIDEALTLGDRIIVMGSKPGRIIEEIVVPMERPRNVTAVRRHATYAPLRERIWERLRASELPN